MADDIHALRMGKADLGRVQAMMNKLHATVRDDVSTLVAPKADKVQTRMQVDSAVSGKADRAYVDSVLETLRRQSRHLLEEMDGIRDVRSAACCLPPPSFLAPPHNAHRAPPPSLPLPRRGRRRTWWAVCAA